MADSAKGTTLALEICAIDRAPYRAPATEAVFPGAMGIFAILPGHAPMVATLGVGVLTVRNGSEESRYAITEGIVQVIDNQVLVLTRTAEKELDIDRDRAEAARKRAEDRLKNQRENVDIARAETALRRAMARLAASASAPHQGTAS
jgi:F-type H+-transporting ATPase subunit epsilon